MDLRCFNASSTNATVECYASQSFPLLSGWPHGVFEITSGETPFPSTPINVSLTVFAMEPCAYACQSHASGEKYDRVLVSVAI